MSKTIKAEGKTYVVPDDATDEEINEIVGPAPAPAPKPLGEQPASASGVVNAMAGQAGRALSTAASDLNPLPLVNAALHPIDTAKGMFNATSNAVGRTRKALSEGNAGEAGKSALGMIPVAGPIFETVARDAMEGRMPEALGHAGAFYLGNKVPGALGKMIRKPAPGLVEKAMGLTANDRKFGAKPGEGILEHTTGIRPGTIAEQAGKRIKDAAGELDTAVRQPGANVPLTPARANVAKTITQVRGEGATHTANEMEPMRRFLQEPSPGMNIRTLQPPAPMVSQPTGVLGPNGQMTTRLAPGAPPPAVIHPMQPAPEFLGMRRGFNKEFGEGSTWGARAPSSSSSALARSTYHELTDALHKARPETLGPDTDIHNLTPVVRAAEAMGRREGIPARLMTRIEKPTGALAAPILGYSVGGAPGAALAGSAQEILSSPSVRMALARGLHVGGKALESMPVRKLGRVLPLANNQ